MKFNLKIICVLAMAAYVNFAQAHNEEVQHGGVLQVVKEIAYELVSSEEAVTIYVTDHGNPVETSGIVGRLVINDGAQKKEAKLEAHGVNELRAKGIRLSSGMRAVAILAMPSGRQAVVQFPMR
jgi:hypothetical protein